MKLSKRKRYILKWNGPDYANNLNKRRAHSRSTMGHGDEDTRVAATAYFCRTRGFFPTTYQELYRRAGVA